MERSCKPCKSTWQRTEAKGGVRRRACTRTRTHGSAGTRGTQSSRYPYRRLEESAPSGLSPLPHSQPVAQWPGVGTIAGGSESESGRRTEKGGRAQSTARGVSGAARAEVETEGCLRAPRESAGAHLSRALESLLARGEAGTTSTGRASIAVRIRSDEAARRIRLKVEVWVRSGARLYRSSALSPRPPAEAPA